MHDHAVWVLVLDHGSNVLEIDRLKVQNIARVVVGADGFWVAVVHYGFDAHITQSVASVHAAVVKLYALAYTVWTAAYDHHFFLFLRRIRI